MATADTGLGPELDTSRRERRIPSFLVRRDPDGACAPDCGFNFGRCLVGWRHPAGTVPWDPRCRNGDVYGLVRVSEGVEWPAEGEVFFS
jgi:hypothetical protein